MQLLSNNMRRRFFRPVALLVIPAMLTQGLVPSRAFAGDDEDEKKVDIRGLMQLPGFAGVIGAIAKTNAAMQDAAKNPMDDWRRQNVRAAISQMPAAIIGLAKEFQNGKLHDDDFPRIQKLLGGFVDLSVGKRFEDFLARPSQDLIPKVGP